MFSLGAQLAASITSSTGSLVATKIGRAWDRILREVRSSPLGLGKGSGLAWAYAFQASAPGGGTAANYAPKMARIRKKM